jgi:hypothetical protein
MVVLYLASTVSNALIVLRGEKTNVYGEAISLMARGTYELINKSQYDARRKKLAMESSHGKSKQ